MVGRLVMNRFMMAILVFLVTMLMSFMSLMDSCSHFLVVSHLMF